MFAPKYRRLVIRADKERNREDAADPVRKEGHSHTGGGSLPRPYTYVGYDTAQDKCIERDGIPEGEEQSDDLRSVRQSEVQYGNRVFWCRWYYVDPVGDEPRTRIREFCLIGEKQERCCRKLSLKRLKRSFMDKWRSKRLLVRTP